MDNKIHKILFTGGGTGGSVSPLLAIAETLRQHPENECQFFWIGTSDGPERAMVEKADIDFKTICSGKLRRYWSWRNFIDLVNIKIGFFQSLFIISKIRPDVVISAGSFVSVPVVWAAWLARVPAIIHQQDVVPGLANKLMAPFVRVVTVTFEKSLDDYGQKAVWTGNPVRQNIRADNPGIKNVIDLKNDYPAILVVGGGTGATALNRLIWESLDELAKFCQIIHLTGRGKGRETKMTNYTPFEFLDADGMAEAYNSADIVISRAGLGVLTELAYLAKPSIIIPMPDSHQEANAKIFADNDAAIVFKQSEINPKKIIQTIKGLLSTKERQKQLGNNMKNLMKNGANEEIAKIILSL